MKTLETKLLNVKLIAGPSGLNNLILVVIVPIIVVVVMGVVVAVAVVVGAV